MRAALAVGPLVVLAGCSIWPQARSDSGRSGNNPFETTIGLDRADAVMISTPG